jgi:hypothetical protein
MVRMTLNITVRGAIGCNCAPFGSQKPSPKHLISCATHALKCSTRTSTAVDHCGKLAMMRVHTALMTPTYSCVNPE